MKKFAFFVTIGNEKSFQDVLSYLKENNVEVNAYPALDKFIRCRQYVYALETDCYEDAMTALEALKSVALYPMLLTVLLPAMSNPPHHYALANSMQVEVFGDSLPEVLCAVREAEEKQPQGGNFAVYQKGQKYYLVAAAVKNERVPNLDYWQKSYGEFCKNNNFGQPCFQHVWVGKIS